RPAFVGRFQDGGGAARTRSGIPDADPSEGCRFSFPNDTAMHGAFRNRHRAGSQFTHFSTPFAESEAPTLQPVPRPNVHLTTLDWIIVAGSMVIAFIPALLM